jgi:hypothetical protein
MVAAHAIFLPTTPGLVKDLDEETTRCPNVECPRSVIILGFRDVDACRFQFLVHLINSLLAVLMEADVESRRVLYQFLSIRSIRPFVLGVGTAALHCPDLVA